MQIIHRDAVGVRDAHKWANAMAKSGIDVVSINYEYRGGDEYSYWHIWGKIPDCFNLKILQDAFDKENK